MRRKVTNCVNLFSLNSIEDFQIDLHINRIIQTDHNGNIELNKYNNTCSIIMKNLIIKNNLRIDKIEKTW